MSVKLLVFILLISLLIPGEEIFGQQTAHKFIKEVNYLLSLPDGYNKNTEVKWPAILFLHGAGEVGNDLEKVKTHGPPKLIKAGQKIPFIVISPQVAAGYYEWSPDLLMLMMKEIIKKYRIDPDRVYLSGLSMGGYGTWDLAMRYPDLFAAIAPICGAGNPVEAWKIRHTPIWIFHGENDISVPVKNAHIMYQHLSLYGNTKLTIYPSAGHDSWTATYNRPDLYSWFLSHKRFLFEEVPTLIKPEKIIGTYISGNDTVNNLIDYAKIYLNDGKLFFKSKSNWNKEQSIFASCDSSFFFQKNNLSEIKFKIENNGDCNSFIYFKHSSSNSKKLLFKRIH